jgi:hypothetical protein
MRLGPRLALSSGPSVEPSLGSARFLSYTLDLTAPSTQTLPASVAAALAVTGRTFTEIWPSFAAASGNITSTGSNAFVPLTVNAGSYARTFPVWNGSSMLGVKAFEWRNVATTDNLVLLSNSAYDLDESLCFVFYGRLLRAPAANRAMLGKQANSTSAGYAVRITTDGRPTLAVHDGTSGITATAPSSGTEQVDGFANGSPQWWAFKMDLTSGNATILGLRATGTPVAMPAGAKTNASNLRLGGIANIGNSCETLQCAWFGVLTGAEAEAFDIDDLNALDTTARPPAVLEGYNRQSCVSPRVAYESGFGVRVMHCHGSAQSTGLTHFPHLYHPDATLSTQKLGFYPTRAESVGGGQKRNLFLRSDDFANAAWTKTNVTATANQAEDPSGFHGAASLTASAANGIVSQAVTTVANKAYYFSVYVRRNGSGDVALKLRAVDTAATATIAEYDRTATSEWTRIEGVFQDLDATNVRFELEIVTSGESIFATFAQVERGFISEYQAQRGTLVDRASSNYYVDNAAGYLNPRAGKVEIVACSYIDNSEALEDQYVFSTDADAAVNSGRILLQISDPNGLGSGMGGVDEAYGTDFQVYDSAGVLTAHLGNYDIDRDAEVTYTIAWDSTGGKLPDAGAAASLAQTGSATSVTGPVVPRGSWSMPLTVSRFYPGARYTFGDPNVQSTHFEGAIERVRIWR